MISKEKKKVSYCQVEPMLCPNLPKLPTSKFSYIQQLGRIVCIEFSNLVWTIVQLIKCFPGIFKLSVANSQYSVINNASNFVRINNRLDLINIQVIVIHLLILIPSVKWLEKDNVYYIMPTSTFRDLQSIYISTNSFNDLVRSYLLIS